VREVCIRCSEHTPDRGVQRKIEHRDATLVGELVRISVERIGSTSLKPLAKQKTVAKRVDRIGEGVLPAPVQVLDSIDAETIDAVLLKLLRGRFQVRVHCWMRLVDVGEIEERVVLDLVTIVPAAA